MTTLSNTRWNNILIQLNTKRVDAGFSSISHTFSSKVKQSDINTLRNGTLDILSYYGYIDLEEALNNVGYAYSTWKTWARNWVATRSLDELEYILDSMIKIEVAPTIEHCLIKKGFDNDVPWTLLEAYQNLLLSTASFYPGSGNRVQYWTAGQLTPPANAYFIHFYKYFCKFDISSYTYGKAILKFSRNYESSSVAHGGFYQNPGDFPPEDNPLSIYTTILDGFAENYWNMGGSLLTTFTTCPLGGATTYHDVTSLVNIDGRIDLLANTPLLPPAFGSSRWYPIAVAINLLAHT